MGEFGKMPTDDNNSLLLQTILHEQRATRDDVYELNKTVVTKDDMNDYRVEMKVHFDEIKTTAVTQAESIKKLEHAETANTTFRKGFVNGVKYVGGAIFVAFLGIASAIIPSYITHPGPSAVSASVNPTSAPTPFHPIHLHLPHVP